MAKRARSKVLNEFRAKLLRAIREQLKEWPGSQQEKAKRLGIHQPRYSVLLGTDDESQFDLDTLILLADKIGIRMEFLIIKEISGRKT